MCILCYRTILDGHVLPMRAKEALHNAQDKTPGPGGGPGGIRAIVGTGWWRARRREGRRARSRRSLVREGGSSTGSAGKPDPLTAPHAVPAVQALVAGPVPHCDGAAHVARRRVGHALEHRGQLRRLARPARLDVPRRPASPNTGLAGFNDQVPHRGHHRLSGRPHPRACLSGIVTGWRLSIAGHHRGTFDPPAGPVRGPSSGAESFAGVRTTFFGLRGRGLGLSRAPSW